jgi:hypothetical protein
MTPTTVKQLREVLSGYPDDTTAVLFAGPEYVSEGVGLFNAAGECIAIISVMPLEHIERQ